MTDLLTNHTTAQIITRRLLQRADEMGYQPLNVYYEDERTPTSREEVWNDLFACDLEWIEFLHHADDAKVFKVMLIYSNGLDVISDYATSRAASADADAITAWPTSEDAREDLEITDPFYDEDNELPVSIRVLRERYRPTEDGDREVEFSDDHYIEFEDGQELRQHLAGEGVFHPSCYPLPECLDHVWMSSTPELVDYTDNLLEVKTYSLDPEANEESRIAWEYALTRMENRNA